MVKASKLRKFLDKVEQKLYQGSAKLRSKIKTQYVDVVVPASVSSTGRKELSHMKSSWIRSFQYDTKTRTLYMTTHKGRTYQWNDVDPEIAGEVTNGLAMCRTNDPTGHKRWWKDKKPSLGAAYWYILVPNFGRRGAASPASRLALPSSPTMGAYGDIFSDVAYDPSKKYHKPTKGRPSREFDKWKRFSRLAKYKKGVSA